MGTTEIEFHEITLADKDWMDEKFAEDGRNACEYTFANNFIWRNVYQVEVAGICGCLVIRFQENGEYCYSYPVGAGDKRAAIEQLLSWRGKGCTRIQMSPVSEADREQLLEWFPGRFLLEADRDDFDYIYTREKLSALAGKKMHGKRNHIARFKDGGDWSYEPMTAENLEECRTMTYSWIKMRSEKWNEEMEEEVLVLHEAFDHMEELGLVGGVLRREGEIVAFTMGEPLNADTFVVHFEKAYPDMQGAYPMINQQFVQNACQDYAYINREEDTGDPGLRKAKLSYYPDILLTKYVAIQSDVVYADPKRDAEQIMHIWKTCFGDEEDYIRFYLERRMTKDNVLVFYEDGKAVSMASFLPIEYLCQGEYKAARYVYAVATLPEYRGRGLAKKLLLFAGEKYKEPLILAPAEESLIQYYEKMGFQRAFPKTRHRIEGGVTALELSETEENVFCLQSVTAAEYVSLRDQRCGKEGYVRWDEAAVQYAMDLTANSGGRTAVVVRKNRADDGEQGAATTCGTRTVADEQEPTKEKDIIMYETEEDTLLILETSLTEERLKSILPCLLEETGTSEAECGQMAGMIWLPEFMSETKVSGDGYLALTLG